MLARGLESESPTSTQKPELAAHARNPALGAGGRQIQELPGQPVMPYGELGVQ